MTAVCTEMCHFKDKLKPNQEKNKQKTVNKFQYAVVETCKGFDVGDIIAWICSVYFRMLITVFEL